MNPIATSSRRAVFAALAFTLTLAALPARAQEVPIKFQLDWRFEGPAALFLVPETKGYYKAEGLNVTVDSGPGSVAGIARVAAGTYPIGFFDINSLARFRDQNPDKDIKGVLMVYDRPPFSIVSLAKSGINAP